LTAVHSYQMPTGWQGLALVMVILFSAACSRAEATPTMPASATAAALTPTVSAPSPTSTPPPTQAAAGLPAGWEEQVSSLHWVAYSPPSADPNRGVEASAEEVRADLALLRQAGFDGLVTYSLAGPLGRDLPGLAQAEGFDGLLLGIWDPLSSEEMAAAEAAANNPIVLGYSVGNEGLGVRYTQEQLSSAIEAVRQATGKPVTTTEEIDDYLDETLLALGDWVFPNAHPFFHNQLDPEGAVRWTEAAYDDLQRRAQRFILFKEVGLPTAGDEQGVLSEASQEAYYQELAQSDVAFVYFEAYDQPWKTTLPVEPHWGIFQADRTPKLLGWKLLGEQPPVTETAPEAFHVYQDADSPDNHFKPSGYMGDTGDIHIDEAVEENPHSGETAIRVEYTAAGAGPNECPYTPPCKWSGVYWQEPPNNWGKEAIWKDKGFPLNGYTVLRFWARAEAPTSIEFMVGGIDAPYGDSLIYPRKKIAKLSQEWQEFEIDLNEADLSHIIGGFGWVTNWEKNPNGIVFYLDDIRFEK
jgi:exo-beta-1,3-glucanase (GH17 family)